MPVHFYPNTHTHFYFKEISVKRMLFHLFYLVNRERIHLYYLCLYQCFSTLRKEIS